MGNACLSLPRARLSSELQIHFKKASVNPDVVEIVSSWFESGAPLGLTLDMFSKAMKLEEQAKPFFDTFDTDKNRKVDAFELFSAFIILASGELDDKIEIIFSIFDFADTGQMNFDEVNILVHSVYRGMLKTCGALAITDHEIFEVCQRMFDSYTLPYDNVITRDQIRRWLRSDVEVASFMDAFHKSFSEKDADALLVERRKAQVDCICSSQDSLSAAGVQDLLQHQAFKETVSNLPDNARDQLLKLICEAAQPGFTQDATSIEALTRVLRAWNAFSMADVSAEGTLHIKELENLLFFYNGSVPSEKDIQKLRELSGCSSKDCLSRSEWMEAVKSF